MPRYEIACYLEVEADSEAGARQEAHRAQNLLDDAQGLTLSLEDGPPIKLGTDDEEDD